MKITTSEIIKAPYEEKLHNQITKFYFTLTQEQDSFTLSLEQIQESSQLVLLYNEDEEIVGVAGLRKMFLHSRYFMVVHKDYQGKGYGKKIISKILTAYPKRSLLLLSVGRSNLNARRLYNTVDFKTIYRHKTMAFMLYNNKSGQWFRWPVLLFIFIKSKLS